MPPHLYYKINVPGPKSGKKKLQRDFLIKTKKNLKNLKK